MALNSYFATRIPLECPVKCLISCNLRQSMSLISNEEEVMWYDKSLGYYLQQPELLLTHLCMDIICYILTQETKITNCIIYLS